MCYDKIESGILVLHKEDLPPLPFLQECFNGFRAEAQERGVTLNFNPPPAGDLFLSHCFHSLHPLTKPPTRLQYFQGMRWVVVLTLKSHRCDGTPSH